MTIRCVFGSPNGLKIAWSKISIFTEKSSLDEAHFHIGGYVNKQNCRIWGSKNPNLIIEKPMHTQRVIDADFSTIASLGPVDLCDCCVASIFDWDEFIVDGVLTIALQQSHGYCAPELSMDLD